MSDRARPLIAPDSRRVECDPAEPHYHVWLLKGWPGVLIPQRPRFGTRQTARKAAIRAGHPVGSFEVKACRLPCPFTVKRPRKRKARKRCRHCGKVP